MMKRTILLAACVALSASACASSQNGGDSAIRNVRVAVDHSGSLLGSLRVWLAQQGGTRSLIGTTDGSGVDTLTVNTPITSGTYQLIAERTSASDVVSSGFLVASGDIMVDWALFGNKVFVRPIR